MSSSFASIINNLRISDTTQAQKQATLYPCARSQDKKSAALLSEGRDNRQINDRGHTVSETP